MENALYRIGSIGTSQIHAAAQMFASQARWIIDNGSFYGNSLSAEEALQVLYVEQRRLQIPDTLIDWIGMDEVLSCAFSSVRHDVLLVQIVARKTLRLDGYALHLSRVRKAFDTRRELLDVAMRNTPKITFDERKSRLAAAGWDHGTTADERDFLLRVELFEADDLTLLDEVQALHRLAGNRMVLVPPVAKERDDCFGISADAPLNASLRRIASRLGIAVLDPTPAYNRTLARRPDLLDDEDKEGFTAALNSELARQFTAEVLHRGQLVGPRHGHPAERAAWFGDWATALKAADEPTPAVALSEIAAIAADHLGDPASALMHWKRRIAICDLAPARLIAIAEVALAVGEQRLAAQLCGKAVAGDPSLVAQALGLSEAHGIDDGPLMEAACRSGLPLHLLLGDVTRHGAAWHRIATLALARGELAGADPIAQPALRRMLVDIRAAEVEGDLPQVRTLWQSFARLPIDNPYHDPARRSMTLTLVNRLRAEAGVETDAIADELLALDPDNLVAGEILGKRLDRTGDRVGAAAAYERMARNNLANARLQIEAIRHWLAIDQNDAAKLAYMRAPRFWMTAAFKRIAQTLSLPIGIEP